jgi:hypothetical protein
MAGAMLATGPGQTQVKAGADQGLGLTGADAPARLKEIEADPYKAPAAPACKSVPDEIAELNKLLGPDVDEKVEVKTTGGDVMRGLVPYGGVFRTLTGAGKKDKLLAQSIMAGYARRGYLRGLRINLSCAAPGPAAPSPALAPAATPGPTPTPTQTGGR